MFLFLIRNSKKAFYMPIYHNILLRTLASEAPHGQRPGKVSGVPLPLEYDLARFVKNVEQDQDTWSTDTPACEWGGIDCDLELNVMGIYWYNGYLSGELDWNYLPRTVVELKLWGNQLEGNVPFECLPSSLENLGISDNKFTGTPNFLSLPPSIKYLSIAGNDFSGWVDFSVLPSSLRDIYLDRNKKLEGILDVEERYKGLHYDVTRTEIIVNNGILTRVRGFEDFSG